MTADTALTAASTTSRGIAGVNTRAVPIMATPKSIVALATLPLLATKAIEVMTATAMATSMGIWKEVNAMESKAGIEEDTSCGLNWM